MDGAPGWARFTRITLPMLRPSLFLWRGGGHPQLVLELRPGLHHDQRRTRPRHRAADHPHLQVGLRAGRSSTTPPRSPSCSSRCCWYSPSPPTAPPAATPARWSGTRVAGVRTASRRLLWLRHAVLGGGVHAHAGALLLGDQDRRHHENIYAWPPRSCRGTRISTTSWTSGT